jgi:phosphohistidine phosphatase
MAAKRLLIVMRHAKAAELPGGPDFERPLRQRGSRDASAAGRWLAGQGLIPAQVYCSTAVRARQTWECVSAELDAALAHAGDQLAAPVVTFDGSLYLARARQVLDVIADAAPDARALMYVGHNPTAADLAEILTGQPADLRTAAIAVIGTDVPWSGLAAGDGDGTGQLAATWSPQARP